MYENRTYAIVNTAEFQAAVDAEELDLGTMFSKIIETDLTTLRHSLDGTQFIIKCEDADDIEYLRARAAECNITFVEYNHAQILEEVAKPEWTINEEV